FLGSVALEGTAVTFRVLALVLGLSFLGQLNGHLMVAGRRQSSLLRVYFLSLPVNVLMNLWLIPRYSFLGAAVSLFLSETVALCYTTWFVWRAFKLRPLLTPFCQAALASVPMLAFLWLSGGSVVFLVGLGAIVYGAGLLFVVKVSQPLRMRT
ncbi:MAG TPA: polysaccharide biosynthesis C-terminal domain-containing protein, partial [Syntrophales bacterium]|nr:polysaccharide biosynthesis C-terminal domain-containing protein [Syntrophales bacterium]